MSLINDMLKDMKRQGGNTERPTAVARPVRQKAPEPDVPPTPGGFDDIVMYNPYAQTGSADYAGSERLKSNLPLRYAMLVVAGLGLAAAVHFGLKENKHAAASLVANDPIYSLAHKTYDKAYSLFVPDKAAPLSSVMVAKTERMDLPMPVPSRMRAPGESKNAPAAPESLSRVSTLVNSGFAALLQQEDVKRALPTNVTPPEQMRPVLAAAPTMPMQAGFEEQAFMEKGSSGTMSKVNRAEERRINEVIEDAQQYIRIGGAGEGEQRVLEALGKNPAHHGLRVALVGTLLAQKKYDQAHETLATGLKIHPDDAEYYYLAAKTFAAEGLLDKAVGQLLIAPPRIHEHPEYYGLLAGLYQKQQRHDLAIQMYWDLVELFPNNSRWWTALGISLESTQADQMALDTYLRALSVGGLEPELRDFVNKRVKQLSSRSDIVVGDTSTLGLATR